MMTTSNRHEASGAASQTVLITGASAGIGKAIITGSSDAWREAAVAAGTDPEATRAAPLRTTAFYTGEPAEDG